MESSQIDKGSIAQTLSVVGKAFVISKTWKIVLFALAAVAGLVYLIYRWGKKSGVAQSIDYNQLPLPILGVGATQTEIDAFKQYLKTDASRLADSLFNNLQFTWTNADLETTLAECKKLPDTKVVGLNNVFNAKYTTKGGSLLTQLKAKIYLYHSDYQRNELVGRLIIVGAK